MLLKVLFLSPILLFTHGMLFYQSDLNKKIVEVPSIMKIKVKSTMQCSFACAMNPICWAFNFFDDPNASICETLPLKAIFVYMTNVSFVPGWKLFKKNEVKAYFNENDETICLPYEPRNEEVSTVSTLGFGCSRDLYLRNNWQNGKRDCRFFKVDKTDFMPANIDGYANVPGTYHEIFQKCVRVNCLGAVCSSTNCWLKSYTHLTRTKLPNGDMGITYWYAICE